MIPSKEVDAYISAFPEPIRVRLEEIRSLIQQTAPDAEELMSYRMPAYRKKGMLVYFAGRKNHIGFYPTSSGIKAFAKMLTKYKYSTGAIQFPHDKKLPLPLIDKIVRFRLHENSLK